jgi:hypothetical protein
MVLNIVGKEDPDLEIALAKDPADMSPNEIGALNNIKTEHYYLFLQLS